MRVVGYSRVSTEEQARGGVSMDIQAEKIELYCKLHNLELVEQIADAGRSGKDLNRPGVRRALELLRTGQVEGLVIAKLDRLTRSLIDLNQLLVELFPEKGCKLFSVGDHIDTTTAVGRMILNVVMSVAQWQREDLVERVQGGHDRIRRERAKPGQVPYGMRVARADLKRRVPMEPDPAEAAVLARILGEAEAGRSLRQIARGLTADGIPTKTGRPSWAASSIQSILTRAARDAAVETVA